MDPRMTMALLHPTRIEILICIMRAGGSVSRSQLTEEIGLSAGMARYHLQVLSGADLIVRLNGVRIPQIFGSQEAISGRWA